MQSGTLSMYGTGWTEGPVQIAPLKTLNWLDQATDADAAEEGLDPKAKKHFDFEHYQRYRFNLAIARTDLKIEGTFLKFICSRATHHPWHSGSMFWKKIENTECARGEISPSPATP